MKSTMMGPNAMRMAEELTSHLDIAQGMKVLDLGCGCGLSTVFLVKKHAVTVFAGDLWISPTDNYHRFQAMGIVDVSVPFRADATQGLPFPDRYFDLMISIDAYHYFGDTKDMLPSLTPLVKKGGHIAIAIPGLKHEFGKTVPEEMMPFWEDEAARTMHSIEWWKDIWGLGMLYLIMAASVTVMIDRGGPTYLHLFVMVGIWNGLKFLFLGPITLAQMIRSRFRDTLPVDKSRSSGY